MCHVLFLVIIFLPGELQGSSQRFSAEFLKEIKKSVFQDAVKSDEFSQKKDIVIIQAEKAKTRYFTYERCSAMINLAAAAYATHKIYHCYRFGKMRASLKSELFLYRFYPEYLKNLEDGGAFFVDATAVLVETLIYKTVAKLMLVCAMGDLSDVVEQGIIRTKKIVSALVL